MELNKIKKAYINISGNLYPNDYINLAKIKNSRIAFDEETLFLTEEQKKLLNSENIREFNDVVIIFCLKNSWGIICNVPIKNYIDKKLLFKGTVNYSLVHPREIFKEAYLMSASYIICIHNHPSGNSSPSGNDKELTKRIKDIGILHGINLIDHIIIGKGNYYSFYQDNNL